MGDEATCIFDICWVGRCKQPANEGSTVCAHHQGIQCRVCLRQATSECSHTGQFVCGTPLCEMCEGFTDITKAHGSWGFMNHTHRRKLSCEPLRRDARGKPVIAVKAGSLT